MRFLQNIINVLPVAQRLAVKSLIERHRKTGNIKGLRQQQAESARVAAIVAQNIGSQVLDPKFAVPGERVSSEDHNSNMEGIYLDLNALYDTINEIGKTDRFQAVTLESDYLKAKAAINKTLTDARVFALRKKFPQFNEIFVTNFLNTRNTTRRVPGAQVNQKSKNLQLLPIATNRVQLENRTLRTTEIYTKTYSQGLVGNLSKNFGPENLADQQLETFWASLIMADSPVTQVFERTTANGQSYQIEAAGPVTELYFKFSHSEKINSVRFLPFGEYPIRVLEVAYKPSSNADIFYPIKILDESTLDWVEVLFDSVFTSEVRITIAQENYRKVTYHLPKRIAQNTDLFQRIFDNRVSNLESTTIADSDAALAEARQRSLYAEAEDQLQELSNSADVDSTYSTDIEYNESLIELIAEVLGNVSEEEARGIAEFYTNPTAIQQGETDEIVEVNKYEYIIGGRETDITYEMYAPTCYYESEKYQVQATTSEIQIEVDEEHVEFKTSWQDDYRKTSTEWEVEIGEGRKLPIHPVNMVDDVDGIPAAKDERIRINPRDGKGFTRLGGYYSFPYRLKRNGEVIPPTEYSTTRITGSVPKIEVTLTGDYLDTSSIYTIDYAVSPDSYSIDVLNNFNSRQISTPENFTGTGPDNDIELQRYPFVNYEVINLPVFELNSGSQEWVYVPPQDNFITGQVQLTPTIVDLVGNVIQTGTTAVQAVAGQWGNRSGQPAVNFGNEPTANTAFFSEISGVPFGYFLQIMDSRTYAELESFTTGATGFTLKSPVVATTEQISTWNSFATGVVFNGDITGAFTGQLTVDYTLGVGVKTDDEVFAFNNSTYSPLEVQVGGVTAENLTNYETLIHPAFSVSENSSNTYQYIHAGKTIYFNQPLNDVKITVSYRWISEYLKLIGVLRCNKIINPDLTPSVIEVRTLLNNMII